MPNFSYRSHGVKTTAIDVTIVECEIVRKRMLL